MIIAVDFDGTIVEHKYPAIGKEIPFAIETLKKLSADGHKLILWTVREGDLLNDAVEYCRSNGLVFYAVNSDFPESNWDNYQASRKIKADVFIDDRNLGGLPEWAAIYEMISGQSDYEPAQPKRSSHDKKKRKDGFFSRLRRRMAESRERLKPGGLR